MPLFNFSDPPYDPFDLFVAMRDFAIEHNSVGLSANQVGLPCAVFVVGDPKQKDSWFAVFNPKIVDISQKTEYHKEGCLSFPNFSVKVKRNLTIRTRFAGWDGIVDTIKLGGLTARIFQHEYDHLQGITIKDRATRYHLEQATKRRKKKLSS